MVVEILNFKEFFWYNNTHMKRGEYMRVVISAGGTGGHIYPAVAIINKIKNYYMFAW